MRKLTNRAIVILLVATAVGLAGSPSVFGAGGAEWWDFDTPLRNGRLWTGVLSMNFQVVDVTSQPDRLIDSSVGPADPLVAKDVRVQPIITVRVESSVRGTTDVVTFSGLVTYENTAGEVQNHFWLVADASLITMGISQFLRREIFTDSTSDLYNGRFTWADPDPSMPANSNVISQTHPGGNLAAGEPLYSIVKIEFQTPN